MRIGAAPSISRVILCRFHSQVFVCDHHEPIGVPKAFVSFLYRVGGYPDTRPLELPPTNSLPCMGLAAWRAGAGSGGHMVRFDTPQTKHASAPVVVVRRGRSESRRPFWPAAAR